MIVKEALQKAIQELGTDYRLEAELLLADVVSRNRAGLLAHDDEELTAEQEQRYLAMVERRQNHEPLQYILGTTNFMGMDLVVTPNVLIPRFDTEKLVEHSLKLLENYEDPLVVDVCTGSGAIAVSIAKYKQNAEVWASDLSEEALQIACKNNELQQTKVQFKQGDLLTAFGEEFYGKFDAIISNPPYITTAEVKELPEDVLKEPMMALWGGEDGLYFYRKIVEQAAAYLQDGGFLAFEIGCSQGESVQKLLIENDYEEVTLLQDWQGLDRVVSGKKKNKNFIKELV